MTRLLNILWFRLRALFMRSHTDNELDEELRDHIARETSVNMARGMSPEEARRVAHAQFGGVERFKEECRDERHVRWLQDIGQDVRHGFRLMRSNKLFSGAVIGTLALGIGATSTIFAIVNGVLLRPLPYPNADRIVTLSESQKGGQSDRAGQFDIKAWQERVPSFAAVAMYGRTSGVLTGVGEPVSIEGGQTAATFFSILGAHAALGRLYDASEEQTGAARVIVLSNALWKGSFGSDSAIINRVVMLEGIPRTVIGVMPSSFDLPTRALYWAPLRLPPPSTGVEYSFEAIARLRDGASVEAARHEMQTILRQRDADKIAVRRGNIAIATTLHDQLYGSARKPLTLLLGAVVMLLLIACANVANLTLARATSRRREFAVRLALGAGRWRLVRQLLIESALLASIGGAIGALVPLTLVGAFVRLSSDRFAGVQDIHVDATVLGFTAAATILAALLFGLAPAMTGSRSGATSALAAGSSRTGSSKSLRILRSSLVVAEVAAALTLITGAGLLTRSFARAMAVNPGYRPQNVYSAYVQLPRARYAKAPDVLQFYNQMADRVRALPGVDMVSVSAATPLGGFAFSRHVKRNADDESPVEIAFAEVDSTYAKVVGLHLIKGRFIDERDVVGAAPAMMLTATAAAALFPRGDALGNRLAEKVDGGQSNEFPVVVGIVDDVAQKSVEEKPVPQIFLSSVQRGEWPNALLVRASLDKVTFQRALKGIVASIDPLQPLTRFVSLQEELSKSFAPRRFNSLLINSFATIALILAMIGLYGLMANAVASRTREIGIRMALGAQQINVVRLVLRHGFLLTMLGIVMGLSLSYPLSRTLSSFLFGVDVHDVATFVSAPIVLACVALIACYVPARQATRISPMVALRND